MDFDIIGMIAAAGSVALLLLFTIAIAIWSPAGFLLGTGTLGFMFHMAYRSDRRK